MRMNSNAMMFGGIGNLDAILTKLQMQTRQAIEKTQHTASFAETLSAFSITVSPSANVSPSTTSAASGSTTPIFR